MNFLNPIMLAGLIGLAVPIAIHMIARHRFPVRDFPAIRLLRIERRDNIFARRLVDPLQLLNRLLILALLALAMARLFSPTFSDRTAPRNLIIVMDASSSMRTPTTLEGETEDGEAAFKRYRSDPVRFEPVSTEEHETIFPKGDWFVVGRVVEVRNKT